MVKPFSQAALRIGGDGVNPTLCTECLGVIPGKQWKKGDPFLLEPGRAHNRYSGLWLYSTEAHVPNDDPYDPLPHISHIIQLFSGKREQFDRIRELGDVRISFIVEWWVPHGNYTLDRTVLGAILDLGVDDISCIFVGIEDEEGEGPAGLNEVGK